MVLEECCFPCSVLVPGLLRLEVGAELENSRTLRSCGNS